MHNPLAYAECANCGRTLPIAGMRSRDWRFTYVCQGGCDPDYVQAYQSSLMRERAKQMIKEIEKRMTVSCEDGAYI